MATREQIEAFIQKLEELGYIDSAGMFRHRYIGTADLSAALDAAMLATPSGGTALPSSGRTIRWPD